MVTVGIDIGGSTHVVACCRDGMARADREILRVGQNRAGFGLLLDWLTALDEPVSRVMMESSGHYWMALASFLRRAGVPVAVVNPLQPKYFAKSRLGRTKSDPADARSLAELAMRDAPIPHDPLEGVELRQACRFAMSLVTEQAKVTQRLLRLVDLGFPELGELFEDPLGRLGREILRLAPTAAAATRRRTATLADANRGPGRRRLGPARAERLRAVAATSIAVPELEPEVAFEVGLLLEQYDLLERQIIAADTRVAGLLDSELARRLQTIPGVGPALAATFIAESGDISRFEDFDAFLAYAGVHPAERSSGHKGTSPETSWHMSKAGNSYLRAAAYRMALVGISHNPVIRAHYQRKRDAGKSKMNALGHCMRKALSLVWGVWRNGQDFDPNWGSGA